MAAPELRDELAVQPGLVDPQVGVGEQAVAVEPLDVVALERRPVAPDGHVVVAHRADEQRADHGPAERGGVEVGLPGRADVEGAARQCGQTFLDQRGAAVDHPRLLRPVGEAAVGDGAEVRFVVLRDVRGVGVGDGAVLAHPGDRDGRVQASRERDPDPLAYRELAEDLRHAASLRRTPRAPAPGAIGGRRATSPTRLGRPWTWPTSPAHPSARRHTPGATVAPRTAGAAAERRVRQRRSTLKLRLCLRIA